jgi:hypothetical protein
VTRFGYTLMTEQSGPKDLVRYAAAAEDAGFDLLVSSDHHFPWLSAQGHAPYAWTLLGAVAQVTQRVELQDRFLTEAAEPLLARLREAAPADPRAWSPVPSGSQWKGDHSPAGSPFHLRCSRGLARVRRRGRR